MTKKSNILQQLWANIFVRNISLMIIIAVVLVAIVLIGLNSYTRHGEFIKVPSVKGLQVEEANGILNASGLSYEISDSLYQNNGTPGAIIEQIPKENSNIKTGRTIFLTIQAKGKQMIPIPELKDFSTRQAEAQLNSLGFKNILIEEVPSAYAGIVISVSYKGKELTPNQKVPKGAPLKMIVGAGGESIIDSIPPSEDINIEESFLD